MSWQKKVVWSEGMFLKPQHFQQQERYIEFATHARSQVLQEFFWGFFDIELDDQALSLGKIIIRTARGLFQDGTPFHFPQQGLAPRPLTIPAEVKNQTIVLALPVKRHGTDEISFDDADQSLSRYAVTETEINDTNSVRATASLLQVGDLRLRLVLESELSDGWMALGAVRVIERRPDNQIVLDRHYIPPTLACGHQEKLTSYTNELTGLLHQRGDTLAARLSQPGRGGVSEVADFLMLELLNRWEPLIRHLSYIRAAHPERLYASLLQLAGDLATFSRDNRRPDEFPLYDHDALQSCFDPLMEDLRKSLSMVMEQNAIQIELHDRNHGVRVAIMPSPDLIKSASFVLAVHADVAADIVRSHFPTQVKIGPVEKIRDLVNLHLPGIALRTLPIAPRQIPYNAGYHYFELNKDHELWRQLSQSSGLALHIAGDFPGLRLEFWAIRG
jgi:type VI secretion system protein ImpJ